MATVASTAVRAVHELSAMGIGLVAIGAVGVWDRSFEVAALVAVQTLHFEMLADQRKAGLRVIELSREF